MLARVSGRWLRLSLSTQLVVATLLALLPLVLAASYVALSLGKQVREQHQLVRDMTTLNHLDASVRDLVEGVERAARQYLLLREAPLLEPYTKRLEELAQHRETLASIPGLDQELDLLRRLLATLEALGAQLASGALSEEGQAGLQDMLEQAYAESTQLGEQIDRRLRASLSAGEEQFGRTLWLLFLIGGLAIPGTLLLVMIGTLAIAKPIRRLAGAIREIGYHRWQKPVSIEGPAELQGLAERLDWMRRKLVVSESRNHALLQHTTHELKSPLATITEASALLAEGVPGDLTPAQERVIDILRDNAANLDALIRQLLSFNAISQHDSETQQAVDLQAVFSAASAQLEGIDEDHQISWHFPERSLRVTTDPLALRMVVGNLLSNAVHYSPRPGEIRVTWEQEECFWHFSVSDAGPGIPEEEIHDIFKLFYRGRLNAARTLKGSGVGLAIVEECVKIMGGKIEVTSVLGKGSTFRVECPRLRDNAP